MWLPTADFLAEGYKLSDGDVGASDTPDNRPLSLEINGHGYHISEIMHCSEGDLVIIAAIYEDGSAVFKIEWGFK